jgi:hypothetical protein
MKLAAAYQNIELMAPDNAALSFFKSPFAAHDTGSAVDIAYGDFGSPACSPVDGEVVDIREFETPTPFKDRDFREYLTAIHSKGFIVRIMHVKPDLEIGDRVHTGEEFGTFIRSGYYYFWNFSHMHVEVRTPENYVRASNNLLLDVPVSAVKKVVGGMAEDSDIFGFTGEVVFSDKRYALIDCPDYSCSGAINGYAVSGYLLDGFIPTGGHALHRFALIGKSRTAPPFDTFKTGGNWHMVYSSSVDLRVSDGKDRIIYVAGVSFILFFGKPLIKIIPTRYGEYLPHCSETLSIQIERQK